MAVISNIANGSLYRSYINDEPIRAETECGLQFRLDQAKVYYEALVTGESNINEVLKKYVGKPVTYTIKSQSHILYTAFVIFDEFKIIRALEEVIRVKAEFQIIEQI